MFGHVVAETLLFQRTRNMLRKAAASGRNPAFLVQLEPDLDDRIHIRHWHALNCTPPKLVIGKVRVWTLFVRRLQRDCACLTGSRTCIRDQIHIIAQSRLQRFKALGSNALAPKLIPRVL